MEKILAKKDFTKFFEDLKKDYEIIGPTRKGSVTTYAYLTFDHLDKAEDLQLNYQITMVPPKRVLSPDNEALFGYKIEGNQVHLEDLKEKLGKKQALLGIHPCDISAISCLDKVFSEAYNDPFYWDRRKNLIVIGLTCAKPGEFCFCNVTKTGPDADADYDLLMTDIGDSYYIKTRSKTGERLVQKSYFRDATVGEKAKREQAVKQVSQELKYSFEVDSLTEIMKEKYGDALWDEYWKRCLTCGNCNMVCPTCHCFSILDKVSSDGTEGKRIRVWDSCHFERFAEMAGGLDLREEQSSRFKHRLYDKFYYTPNRYNVSFCVGCGRCIEFCQSQINICDALIKLQEK